MGGWDPKKDLEKAGRELSNAATAVTQTVNTVATGAGNVWDNTRSSFERSDVGRAVSTLARPATSLVEGTGDIVRGVATGQIDDGLTKAGRRVTGAMLQNLNPIGTAAQAFDFVDKGLRSNEFTSAWAESGEAARSLMRGNALTSGEKNSLVNMWAKEAAIATAVAFAPTAAGYASSAGTWAAANPVSAAVVGGKLYEATRTGNYSDLARSALNEVTPGLGNAVVSQPASTRQSPVSSARAPASTAPVNAVSTYSVGGLDTKTMVALGGAFVVLLALIFKRMR